MDPVLALLRLRNRQEQEQEARSVRGDKADLLIGLVVDVPVQSASPEARQTQRIVGVEAQRDESSTHLRPPSSPPDRISTTIARVVSRVRCRSTLDPRLSAP